ncbi:MAG TPA: hypothetical protein VFM01_04675, partial [Nakamurella sp.]|nr:hypothetical protein [Nakamurella sp.]
AADAASTAASNAQSTASAAQTAANGKNKITYSSGAASGSGTLQGDVWFQVVAGVITAQWIWTGSVWQQQTISSSVIGNIDAGKITTGTLTGITITGTNITGTTITGSVFQTAEPGVARVEISTAALGVEFPGSLLSLIMDTAAAAQSEPGGLSFGYAGSSGKAWTTLKTPTMDSGHVQLDMDGYGGYTLNAVGKDAGGTLRTVSMQTVGGTGTLDVTADLTLNLHSGVISLFSGVGGGSLRAGDDGGTGPQGRRITWNSGGVSAYGNLGLIPIDTGAGGGILFAKSDKSLTLATDYQGVGHLATENVSAGFYDDAMTWDSTGIVAVKKIFLDSGKTQSISNDAVNNLIWIDNNGANTLQMGTGSGRLQLSGADKLVWASDGVYVYNKLYLRNAGGSETDGYLLRSGNNVEMHADVGAFKLIGNLGATLEVTTPAGSPGIRSATIYGRTTAGGANVNVGSDGTLARSTSSLAWKDKVKDQTLTQARRLLLAQPITYQSLCLDDDKRRRFTGLGAEQIHAAGLRELVSYDSDGQPDGVMYERAVPHLITLLRDLTDRIEALEAA